MGGTKLTPGESVDALTEAIDVIRGLWDTAHKPSTPAARTTASTAPSPARRRCTVELWLGAYKPRMLKLTGAQADGWLPSMSYAEPQALAALNAPIDAAAADAGRDPCHPPPLQHQRRRPGGPEAPASGAELTLADGMSTFILAVSDEQEIRTFARRSPPRARAGRAPSWPAAPGGTADLPAARRHRRAVRRRADPRRRHPPVGRPAVGRVGAADRPPPSPTRATRPTSRRRAST